MGSCYYYAQIEYLNEQQATEALPKFIALQFRLAELHRFLKTTKGNEVEFVRKAGGFEDVLAVLAAAKVHNAWLYSQEGFVDADDLDGETGEIIARLMDDVVRVGCGFLEAHAELWHGASLDWLEGFARMTGALKYGWISEEDISPWEAINPESLSAINIGVCHVCRHAAADCICREIKPEWATITEGWARMFPLDVAAIKRPYA